MRARFNQVIIVALCAPLLAICSSALVGCGGCGAQFAAPPHAVLTVENGVVYGESARFGFGGKLVAVRASDGKALWQNAENPYFGPHGESEDVRIASAPVAPVVDGQTVIETMGVGLFAALRTTDGKMLWHSQPLTELATSVDGSLTPPPVVADGVIYAAAGYGAIAAWDERDGHTLWVSRFAPDLDVARPTDLMYDSGLPLPVVVGGIVYASAGPSVYALRVSDGSALWSFAGPAEWGFAGPADMTYSTPVVTAQTLYVADSHNDVFALDPATGATRWSASRDLSIMSPVIPNVVVQGQIVYVAESLGNLVRALDTATGAQRWRYQTSSPAEGIVMGPLAPVVVADGRVYVASLAWGLFVVNAASGRELWHAALDSDLFNLPFAQLPVSLLALSIPAVDQGTMVMASTLGAEAWDTSYGQRLWAAHIPDQEDPSLVQSAAVADGIVYLAQGGTQQTCSFSGLAPRVLALRATDGAKLWQDSI